MRLKHNKRNANLNYAEVAALTSSDWQKCQSVTIVYCAPDVEKIVTVLLVRIQIAQPSEASLAASIKITDAITL